MAKLSTWQRWQHPEATLVDKLLPGAIVIAFLMLLLALMAWGWSKRKRRDASIGTPQSVPADAGAQRLSVEAFYVATTNGGEPLRRVVIPGLGFRARATVTVTDLGLVLEIPGESGIFIPAASIVGLAPATWTIDRVVESDGLLMLAWRLDDTTVDSYFRVAGVADRLALVQAIKDIAPAASAGASESEEHNGL